MRTIGVCLIRWCAVLLLAGCASAPAWEPVAARHSRAAFETCKQETGETDTQLLWLAPDGILRMKARDEGALKAMQDCLTKAAGFTWVK